MRKWILVLASVCVPLFAGAIDEAEEYNANSGLQLDWATAVLQRIDLRGDERILDVGSGDGKVTARMAASVPAGWVVGLDLSLDMQRFASTNFQALNLLFVKGDLYTAPFIEQFDLVTAFCSLIWMQDQQAAFESIRESLVPGGLFVAVQPASRPTNLSPASERIAASPRWAPFFPNFQPQRFYLTRDECLDLLDQVGLEPIFVEETYTREHYPSMEAFLDWLRPITGFSSHLPPRLREQFLREMAAEMVEVEEEGVWLPDNKLEVIAHRPVD